MERKKKEEKKGAREKGRRKQCEGGEIPEVTPLSVIPVSAPRQNFHWQNRPLLAP
jgi:hypothetical protein